MKMLVTPWCSGYHYCTMSFNKAWTQVLHRFESWSQHVELSLLFWLLSDLSIYHFCCCSMLFLPLYLSFHLDSLHRHPDSPHFLYFHPDSPHSHADSPHPHPHPIPHIPTLILRISLIPFSNSPFCLLQIACSVCIL